MKSVVVIPCFNEVRRLDFTGLEPLSRAGVEIVIVDDGSSDDTAIRAERAGLRVLRRPHRGKAEAVRAGLHLAFEEGSDVAGWLDADLATPASEWLRLHDALVADASLRLVLGSRVAHLGAHIERRAMRHYLGRVFATAASLTLGLAVYDTQCGAKVLRFDPRVMQAVSTPFATTWAFDVELMQRLMHAGLAPETFREVPLTRWRDVGDSRLGMGGMVRGASELFTLARRRRW
jgi:glycosyltransferase involved in cell wall biosynthesis